MGYFQLLPLELRNKMEHENELKMCEKTWDFETACCIHTVYRLYSKTIATLLNFLEFLISSWLVWEETKLLCLNIPLTSLNHFSKADNRHKKIWESSIWYAGSLGRTTHVPSIGFFFKISCNLFSYFLSLYKNKN